MSDKYTIINDYCKIIKKIISFYEMKSEHPNKVSHVRQARIFINETPELVLERTGPEFFERRDSIISGDLSPIIAEKDTIKDTDAQSIVDTILDVWEKSEERDKNSIIKSLQNLLRLYTDYLLLHH